MHGTKAGEGAPVRQRTSTQPKKQQVKEDEEKHQAAVRYQPRIGRPLGPTMNTLQQRQNRQRHV